MFGHRQKARTVTTVQLIVVEKVIETKSLSQGSHDYIIAN